MLRLVLTLILALLLGDPGLAQDWNEFLGQGGKATSKERVPTTWNESENLSWKFDLPGAGSSSPIIVGQNVFVTCYSQSGNRVQRHLVCVNKTTGKKMWQKQLDSDDREDGYQGYLTEHGYASNTPTSDGEQVFVFFGKGGVHAFNLDGILNWSVDVGKESSNRQWGSAASLVLFEDSVIVNAAEESQAILALDKKTGKEIWRQEAAMLELAYGTPRILTLDDGSHELVLGVPGEIWSLDPRTGKLKWSATTSLTGNVCPSVIVDGQILYAFGGYRSSGSLAIRAGGKDDVTKTHMLWNNRASSYVATPLLHDGKFYWIDDHGVAFCTSSKDGEIIYRERVDRMKGGRPVYASPVLIGDHVYVVSRQSGTFVYLPGPTFTPLAQNIIGGDESDFNASPAVSDGRLYLRSNQALYCVGL